MPDNAKTQLNVLLVEASLEDAELILQKLDKAGFEVTAKRVEDEKSFQAQLDDAVDVILAEYALPGFNARNAIRCLRESGLNIPFIIVTGALSDEDAVACIRRGASDYLRKGRLERLGQAVQAALEQQRLRAERQAAEQALSASEQKYRLLFNEIRDPIFLVEVLADGHLRGLIEVNNAACLKLGYTRAALLKLSLEEINAPEQAMVFELVAQNIMTDGDLSFATELVAKSGKRIPVKLSLRLIDWNGKKALAIAHDISGQREVEEIRYQIHETEKKMLGMELHDSIGQYLTALAFKSKILENQLKSRKLTEAAEAEELGRLVNQTSAIVRQVAQTLFPVGLERRGLKVVLLDLLAFLEAQFDVRCQLDYQLPTEAVNVPMATHLYRIVQETMHNAIKHNKARNLTVRLLSDQGRIELTIVDDGSPSVNPLTAEGIGRGIMEYRCRILNASLTQRAAPKGGNETILTLPCLAAHIENL